MQGKMRRKKIRAKKKGKKKIHSSDFLCFSPLINDESLRMSSYAMADVEILLWLIMTFITLGTTCTSVLRLVPVESSLSRLEQVVSVGHD